MWRLAAGLAIVACAATSCALNRPEVKSLRDPDAEQIAFADPIPTTVSALNAVPSHCGPAGNRRVRAEERRVYRVVGRITRVKREGDHDVHIALADLQKPRERLIVELKDPDFRGTARSPHRARLVEATRSLDALVAAAGVTRRRGPERRDRARHGRGLLRHGTFPDWPIPQLYGAAPGAGNRARRP